MKQTLERSPIGLSLPQTTMSRPSNQHYGGGFSVALAGVSIMLRNSLVEMALILFITFTLGGMLYFLSATLVAAPVFDNAAPDADAMRYP